MMFSGQQLASMMLDIGVTHVVTLPDSTIGAWGDAMESTQGLEVIRVCREGEAWAIAHAAERTRTAGGRAQV